MNEIKKNEGVEKFCHQYQNDTNICKTFANH